MQGNNHLTKIFVSYNHVDKHWLERLKVHIKPLIRDGALDLWDDTRILPGSHWLKEIKKAIEEASVGILLVSADFLASDFIMKEEVPSLLRLAQERGLTILPVLLSPSRFLETREINKFQAVNPPSKTLEEMTTAEIESTFLKIANRIAESLRNVSQGHPPMEKISCPPFEFSIGTSDRRRESTRKFDEAMNIRIRCSKGSGKACWTKVAWKVPISVSDKTHWPGWQRVLNPRNYNYLSKTDIDTNPRWKDSTEEYLCWARNKSGGPSRPMLFRLKKEILHPFTTTEFCVDNKTISFFLHSVDFIPMRAYNVGYLGICFNTKEDLSVKEYLKWISQRGNFSKLPLIDPIRKKRGPSLTRLLAAILHGLRNGERPTLLTSSGLGFKIGQPSVILQYVLSDGPNIWGASTPTLSWRLAWDLMRTLSRPNADYPKEELGRFKQWTSRYGKNTLYSAGRNTIALWASANEEFNRSTKPKVLMEPLYFLFALAEEMWAREGHVPEGMANLLRENHRGEYWEHIAHLFNKLLGGPWNRKFL